MAGSASFIALELTRLRREHGEFVRELFADARVGGQFIDPTALVTASGANAFAIASAKVSGQRRFAAVRDGVTAPIGLGLISDSILERGYATLGYAVVPAEWGRGYGTAIARRLCGFGFAELGAPEVRASVKPANAASQHVLAKLGFRNVGAGERVGPDGAAVPVDHYALACSAWNAS